MRTVMNLITGSETRDGAQLGTSAVGVDGEQNVVTFVELADRIASLQRPSFPCGTDGSAAVGPVAQSRRSTTIFVLFRTNDKLTRKNVAFVSLLSHRGCRYATVTVTDSSLHSLPPGRFARGG